MKAKFTIVMLLLCSIYSGLLAQIPLVYNVENTGASCTPPPLPTIGQLPLIQPLPDPFLWANGSGRSTSFSDWECHRNEFKKQIENYEIGLKPPKPDTISATYTVGGTGAPDTLKVFITRSGQSMTLTSQVYRPTGSGPFPAVIGMNSASGSIPSTVFTNRNILRITYNHDQVTTYNNPQNTNPFYRLYPDQNIDNSGQYAAWAWGVSRIIDGLELVQSSLPVDLSHIGVTGCSYAGKMALFAGAFDERIALTIAQESGGGGAPAWRVSETLGSVEKLGATSNQWFKNDMFQFSGLNVPKLPHDHHELMAMIAPRALLATGNTDFEWLANPSAYVSARATKSIYNTLGISDRFGFYIDGGHNHCAVPNSQLPAIQAFVDKFLASIPNVNTDTITVNPFPNVNYQRWYQWWGTGNPILPPLPPDPPVPGIYKEAECARVGSRWVYVTDTTASNGKYVVVRNGLNSTASAPTGDSSFVVFTFNIDSVANYNIRARVNCPTGDDDSYWIKIDNGTFTTVNNLTTSGWQWVPLASANLAVGAHTFTMAYREDGAKLDKLIISTSNAPIPGIGDTVINCGVTQIPLVFGVENSGVSCAPPPLPTFTQLNPIEPFPDPFLWANGSGRSTSFSDWECHRNEYKAQIENYEIGIKPPKPDTLSATYTVATNTSNPDTLRVFVTRNGQSMTLTSQVYRPTGSGPFPAIIGMNSASGSIPATVFTSRNIARITFNHNNVTTYGNPALTDPFYRLYPEYNLVNSGQYSAWAWGVSRLIDGLALVQSSLPVDMSHIGVTGCSYAGKMALYSGAFDERVALTIAQESGGGGAPAWRASHALEPNGSVEKIDNTDYKWFKDSLQQFSADNVYKLPYDHHELMAMVAPRALLATGNTDFTWLSNQANYVTSRATKSIYSTLGISDRFGFYIDGGHNHCAVPNSQVPAIQAFVDKFLAGIPNVNTDTVTVNPFPQVNYQRWYQWWGSGSPILPPPPGRRVWLETECATVGSSWNIVSDTAASNTKYVTVRTGLSSTANPPTGDSAYLVMPFSVDSAATYNLVTRAYSSAGDDYSFWMKLDNGAYQTISSVLLANGGFENGLTTWTTLNSNGATITANSVAAEAHTGNGSMKVLNPTAQTGNQWRVQVTSATFPTTIGKQYIITYWVRAANPNGSIRLSTGPTSAQYQADQAIGTAWQQVSWTITASLSSTTFLFDMGQVANTYYIDDASVKEVNSGTGSWQWIQLASTALSVGSHTLSFGYRDGSPKLDKVLVTTFSNVITGKGDLATNCSGGLPVNLLSYQASLKQNKTVLLTWTTTVEVKNKQYRLERSADGISYTTLATVAGKGTYNGKSDYSYTDLKPLKGMNYYRLVQEDIDGNLTDLGVRAVNVTDNKALIRVFPNPAHTELNIDLGTFEMGQKQISVYDLTGKKIFSKLLSVKNGLIKVNLNQYPGSGMYMVKIGDTDHVSVFLQ